MLVWKKTTVWFCEMVFNLLYGTLLVTFCLFIMTEHTMGLQTPDLAAKLPCLVYIYLLVHYYLRWQKQYANLAGRNVIPMHDMATQSKPLLNI